MVLGSKLISEKLTIQCSDCRNLTYAEYGDPKGIPVFHCNGSGGSRLEWPFNQSILEDMKVRFISVDRPGHGFSDPQSNRKLLDWPDDIATLADYLGIKQFHIEGWSAGGPYALACAYKLSDRVINGAILSGIAPYERPNPYLGLPQQIQEWMQNARENPNLVFPFREMMAKMLKEQSASMIGKMLATGIGEDYKAIELRTNLHEMLGNNIKEGYRQGFEGPAEDDIIINSPWGFKLQDIETRIDVWQGEVDLNVPLNQGEYQHSILPNSRFHLLQNTGHLFPLVRWKEILAKLIES